MLTLVHLATRARGSLLCGPALGLVVVVYSHSTQSPAAVADVSIAAVTGGLRVRRNHILAIQPTLFSLVIY